MPKSPQSYRSSIYLDSFNNQDLITSKLSESGICVLKSFFSSRDVQSLKNSISRLKDDNLFFDLSPHASMASLQSDSLQTYGLDFASSVFKELAA